MRFIAIADDTLINPDRILWIERKRADDGSMTVSVNVEGRTFDVNRPTAEFMQALNEVGVDLTKQFFAV